MIMKHTLKFMLHFPLPHTSVCTCAHRYDIHSYVVRCTVLYELQIHNYDQIIITIVSMATQLVVIGGINLLISDNSILTSYFEDCTRGMYSYFVKKIPGPILYYL